jgi:serine protease Do
MYSKFSPRRDGIGSFRCGHMTVLASGVALALVAGPIVGLELARAQSSETSGAMAQLPSLSPLVKNVMPAVVNISVEQSANVADESGSTGPDLQLGPGSSPQGSPFDQAPFDQYMKRFFGDQGRDQGRNGMPSPRMQATALGSGFIIDPSGLVVTDNHVVDGSKKVTVVLQDGSKHVAKILGRDPKVDLALLKIDVGHPLPYLPWGDSSAEQVGDWVVAVGNPFGLGGTVSAGIVSARGRDIHSGPYDDFLQIDAPINRGNSGGPTFNLKGEVIGINTAIYSPNGGSVGIAFATPSNLAKPVIDQLREHGKVSRGWLGVEIQQVTPEIAKGLGLQDDRGALVANVTGDSPAEKAGIRQGDVIESFNGHEVTKLRDLPITVAETPVGTEAKVQIRRNGQDMTLNLRVAEQPANPQVASNEGTEAPSAERSSVLGLRLESLTSGLRNELHVPAQTKGVVVRSISESSPLASLNLQPGDVIVSVNQEPVATPAEAVAKLKQAEANKNLVLLVNRHGVNQYVAWSGQGDQG